MARKTMRGSARTMNPAVFKDRAEKALVEGRQQQALDAARTLFELAPEPANRALLVRATLSEAERLLTVHQSVKASTLAGKTWNLVESAEEKMRLAEILARSGNISRAWLLAQQLASPALTGRILGHVADAAIRQQPTLTDGLPADFQAHKDAILRSFKETQAGNDEQARATLQVIGLGSAFLEWKVLLRGFLAYYQGDDAKALENWHRLSAQRVPAQLAAPFLSAIDPAFRASQSAETLGRLQELLDRVDGGGLVGRLRTLRRHLANERHLTQAFRQAEALLPLFKADAPRLLPRLAGCFFWAIVDRGTPEDVQRYLKIFGGPPDDPQLTRLEALALEHRQQFEDAHSAWQDYEKTVAARASALPPGQADLIRSMVWRHMGSNAAMLPENDRHGRRRGGFFGFFDDEPRPLKPNAETCFKRSQELAPDQLEAHSLLVQYHVHANKSTKALAAAKRLLKQFPDHAPTLELVGDLSLKKGNYSDAVAFILRAIQANPLDTRLRIKISIAQAARAEQHAAAKRFDKARAAFQEALTSREGASRCAILCQWAACEFLADNPSKAEELLQEARGQGHPLAVALAMLVDANRLKFANPLKDRFDVEFNELLRQKPDAAAAAALAAQMAMLRKASSRNTYQKPLEKKVTNYLDKAKKAEFTESQLQQICDALADLSATKLLQTYFRQGQRRFPANPRFYLAEVDHELESPPYKISPMRVAKLLDKIRELASSMPPVERQDLLKQVQDRDQKLRELNPFSGLFGFPDLLDAFGASMDGDDFDDDDDDDELDDDFF